MSVEEAIKLLEKAGKTTGSDCYQTTEIGDVDDLLIQALAALKPCDREGVDLPSKRLSARLLAVKKKSCQPAPTGQAGAGESNAVKIMQKRYGKTVAEIALEQEAEIDRLEAELESERFDHKTYRSLTIQRERHLTELEAEKEQLQKENQELSRQAANAGVVLDRLEAENKEAWASADFFQGKLKNVITKNEQLLKTIKAESEEFAGRLLVCEEKNRRISFDLETERQAHQATLKEWRNLKAENKRQADLLALAKEEMDAQATEVERLKRAKLTIREVICGDEVLQILNAHETQNGVRIICE